MPGTFFCEPSRLSWEDNRELTLTARQMASPWARIFHPGFDANTHRSRGLFHAGEKAFLLRIEALAFEKEVRARSWWFGKI
jgi:hypothetical protein